MSALLPPAMLLLWSGLAATLLLSLILAPLLGATTAALAFSTRRPALPQALLFGILAYPLVYGAGFAISGEASIISGGALGLLHALLLAFRSLRAGGRPLVRSNADRILLRFLYGALLGFLYVTP